MVTVSVLEGGWIVFDQIRLEGADELVLEKNNEYAFLRNVAPAEYEMEMDGRGSFEGALSSRYRPG